MAKRGPREYPWLRLYVETTRDLKIRLEPVTTRWAWIAVMTLARRSPQPGRLLLSDGVPVTVEHVADEANIKVPQAAAAVATFRAKEMVGEDQAGVLLVLNWGKRQPESGRKSDGNTPDNSPELDGNTPPNSPEFHANNPETPAKFDATLLLEGEREKGPSDPTEAETEAESHTLPSPEPQTGSGGKRSAIAGARALAVVPSSDKPASVHVALLKAAEIAFGHVGQTESERRKARADIHELATADPPVTVDEFGELVAEYRRRGWRNPGLHSIVTNLGKLRAPYDAGRDRPAALSQPDGYDALRETYADLDPGRRVG